VALYRQWRPQDFEQLVGQEHISTTLKNAVATNRIAHAYLFSGPRGTGKTSMAKILAKALNCIEGPTTKPCNKCDNCQRITDGSSMDVLEIDAASNRGIDEIRELREKVKFTPVDGRFKVYIIDEVHMLTTEAFNALLKTLEEPPAHAIFILATTEPYKIPATILSRCQRYDFRRISTEDIVQRLNEVVQQMDIPAEAEAVEIIARAAEGGLRDALSMLDQCIAFEGDQVTTGQVRAMLGLAGEEWLLDMEGALLQRNVPEALAQIQNLMSMGKDPRQVLLELIVRFRNKLVHHAGKTEGAGEFEQPEIQAEEYIEIIKTLSDAAQEAKWASQPRIILELAVIEISRRKNLSDIAELMARIEKLERILGERSEVPKQVQPVSDFPLKQQSSVQFEMRHTPTSEATPLAKVIDSKVASDQSLNPAGEQNLEDLWERILAELLKNNKRAIHTCLLQGELLAVTPENVMIGFQLSFYKERVEKEDYRGILAKLITQITGENRQVRCCLTSETEHARQVLPQPETQKDNPLVRDAVAMFGEQVVTIENK